MDDRHLVAGNVRAALARAEIRVNGLPKMVGGSQSYWSRRTTGELPFSIDDLSALADLLGMDPRAGRSTFGRVDHHPRGNHP